MVLVPNAIGNDPSRVSSESVQAPPSADPIPKPQVGQSPAPADKMESAPTITRTVTPNPTGAEKALDPKTTSKTPAASETTGTKIFGFIDKMLKSPIFQGVLAFLSAFPGLGQVVSGVAAILSLVNIIDQWITNKSPPDLSNIASALCYLGGIFVPALGTVGGLIGALRATEYQKANPAGVPQTSAKPATPEAPLKAMEESNYEKALGLVESGLKGPTESTGTDDFADAIHALRQEQVRLAKLPDDKNPRLLRLNALFSSEEIKKLPQERLEKLKLDAVVPRPMEDRNRVEPSELLPVPAG